MDELSGDPGREHRFRRLYVETYADVLRFVQRRTGTDRNSGAAEDVVAEVFLAVWRRVDDVPGGARNLDNTDDNYDNNNNDDDDNNADAARAWIFGIARNLLLNNRRGARRQQALGVRLADAEHIRTVGPAALDPGAIDVALQVDLQRAWRELSDVHQEALALSAFEGLDSNEAAVVVGITATAFRLRLSRARKALRSALGAEHSLTVSATTSPGKKLPDHKLSERL